jgi:hypothetical protein
MTSGFFVPSLAVVSHPCLSLLHAAPIADHHWHRGIFMRDYRRLSQYADIDSVLLKPPQSYARKLRVFSFQACPFS